MAQTLSRMLVVLTMLDLPVDKFALERPLRRPLVDQERSRRRVRRRLRTRRSHHTSKPAPLTDKVVRDGKVLARGDDVAVPEMGPDDGVAGDGPVGDDGLGVV